MTDSQLLDYIIEHLHQGGDEETTGNEIADWIQHLRKETRHVHKYSQSQFPECVICGEPS